MMSRIFPWSILIVALSFTAQRVPAQTLAAARPLSNINPSSSAAGAAYVTYPTATASSRSTYPFSQFGVAVKAGLGGPGFDVAMPLARKFNLRLGANFFSYSTSFQDQGANVGIRLHMTSGHAALDWFPFDGRFRLSPLVVFGNNNRALATAIIPSGSDITLNGHNYISSYTDPLRGAGRIDFRKVSPGFTFGFGNILPRKKGRFSVPVEMGFYYVGQPGLQVSFTGSACDPNFPPSVGCQSVDKDPGFQKNLAAFIARNNHNLSYASFFPVLSVGFAYRLW